MDIKYQKIWNMSYEVSNLRAILETKMEWKWKENIKKYEICHVGIKLENFLSPINLSYLQLFVVWGQPPLTYRRPYWRPKWMKNNKEYEKCHVGYET